MCRIANVLIAVIVLCGTSRAAAQTPDVIETGSGPSRYSRLGVKTLGAAVHDAKQIVVWRVKQPIPGSGIIQFENVRTLKKPNDPAGTLPLPTEVHLRTEFGPSWNEPDRVAVVFIKKGQATACFGTRWHEMGFDEDRNVWTADDREVQILSTLYSGSTDDLIGHVRSILAGREVVVTAEKVDADRGAYAQIKPSPIWRIKASLQIDAPPKTIRSPNYVGWGAGESKDLPRMVAMLTHPKWWMRSLAIRDISSLGDKAKSALPELWNRFTDERPLLRIEAAEAALRIDPSSDLPLLAITLEQRNPDRAVREEAANALGRWKKRAAPLLPWLLASFEKEQAPFLFQTVVLLGEWGANAKPELKREIAQVIARKIRAANSVVSTEIKMFGSLLPDEGQSLSPRLFNIESERNESVFHSLAARALLDLGKECAPAFPILKLMVRAGANGSDLAAQALLQFAPDGPPWLAKQLTAKMPPNKSGIVRALREVPDKAKIAIPGLRLLLEDEDEYVRIDAARALLEIDRDAEGSRAALAIFKIAFGEKSFFKERARSLVDEYALLQTRFSTAEGRRYERYLLLKTIRDPDSPERVRALYRLEEMGAEAGDVVPALWRLMERETTPYQLQLMNTIAKIDLPIERHGLVRDSRPRLVEKLRKMFGKESHPVVEMVRAAWGLGSLAAPLMRDIQCYLGHPDDEIRWCAVNAIAAIGPPAKDAISDLIRLMDEDSPSMQEAAIVALCKVSRGNPMAVQRLRDWCATENLQILSSLQPGDLGNEKITPILLKAIQNDDDSFDGRALKLLRATDPEAARKLERR